MSDRDPRYIELRKIEKSLEEGNLGYQASREAIIRKDELFLALLRAWVLDRNGELIDSSSTILDILFWWGKQRPRRDRSTDWIGPFIESNEKISLAIEKTKRNIGLTEFGFFAQYFWIQNDAQCYNIINQIQTNYTNAEWEPLSPPDGVIWRGTLFAIYTNFYFSENSKNFNFKGLKNTIDSRIQEFKPPNWFAFSKQLVQDWSLGWLTPEKLIMMRYLMYRELEIWYNNWTWNGKEFSGYIAANIFRRKKDGASFDDFFSDAYPGTPFSLRQNTIGATIDDRITWTIPPTIEEFWLKYNWNTFPSKNGDGVYVIKDETGKYICLTYQKGKLLFASFCSPWLVRNWKWPGSNSPSDFTIWWLRQTVGYYYDDPQTPEEWGGPMPVRSSTSVKNVRFHLGFVNGKKDSHGCFRLPWWATKLMMEVVTNGTPWKYVSDWLNLSS